MNKILSKWGNFILSDWRYAAGLAFIFAIIPFFGWVSSIVVAFYTLRFGPRAGLSVLSFAVIPSVVWSLVTQQYYIFVLDVVSGAGFIWLMASTLRHTCSWPNVLEASIAVGFVVICAVHYLVGDVTVFYTNYITQFKEAAAEMQSFSSDQLKFFDQLLSNKVALTAISKVATGVLSSMFMVSQLLNLMLARWWQAIIFNPGGLQQELKNIRFSLLATGALVGCVAAIYLDFDIAIDLLVVFMTVFVAAGISASYAMMKLFDFKAVWMVIVFTVLVLLSPYSLLVLILLAMIDSCINIRKLFSEKRGVQWM